MSVKQPEDLIRALLNRSGYVEVRDDAAMDLSDYDEPEVERALVQVASDPGTEGTVVSSCGESLAEIWARQGRLPEEALACLRGEALAGLAGYVRRYREANPASA